MGNQSRPGGNFQAFLSLVGFVLFMWAFWNVGSVYAINWALKDEMHEAALSQRNEKGNADTIEKLEKVITKLGLDEWMSAQNCEVVLDGMNRKVTCEYERDMKILFGIKRKVSFRNETSTPLL
ncbi:MAG: hypothetical protein NDJ94_23235 [Vicinamibacteria bacterium]|nr:hypothetical protein [Vicinamibacteria bacterium]